MGGYVLLLVNINLTQDIGATNHRIMKLSKNVIHLSDRNPKDGVRPVAWGLLNPSCSTV
jgi:hypothetical protein